VTLTSRILHRQVTGQVVVMIQDSTQTSRYIYIGGIGLLPDVEA
jgi:hypothetical protein